MRGKERKERERKRERGGGQTGDRQMDNWIMIV